MSYKGVILNISHNAESADTQIYKQTYICLKNGKCGHTNILTNRHPSHFSLTLPSKENFLIYYNGPFDFSFLGNIVLHCSAYPAPQNRWFLRTV